MNQINLDLLRRIANLCLTVRDIDVKQAKCVYYEGKRNPQYIQEKYIAEVELVRLIKLAGF